MKFDQLFGGSMPQNVHLPKISSLLQFAAEMWALQVLISPYKPFRLFLQFRTGATLERFVWDGSKL